MEHLRPRARRFICPIPPNRPRVTQQRSGSALTTQESSARAAPSGPKCLGSGEVNVHHLFGRAPTGTARLQAHAPSGTAWPRSSARLLKRIPDRKPTDLASVLEVLGKYFGGSATHRGLDYERIPEGETVLFFEQSRGNNRRRINDDNFPS